MTKLTMISDNNDNDGDGTAAATADNDNQANNDGFTGITLLMTR